MELQALLQIVDQQEAALRFPAFNSQVAWELGTLLHQKIVEANIPIVVAIRAINGKTLFQYSSDGANFGSQAWLDRKFKTVQHFERSTLHQKLFLQSRGATLADRGLSIAEFVAAGGGFPIRLTDSTLVGVLLVSGLKDTEDHAFIIDALSDYLQVKGVPAYPIN